jgi:hypothetical protein
MEYAMPYHRNGGYCKSQANSTLALAVTQVD